MQLRGVIFDLDGTLVDSGLDFPAIRREMGLKEGTPILEGLAEVLPGAHLDHCLRVLDRHEAEAAERATLMPGARELLDSLTSRGIPQAVLTRNSRTCAHRVLKRLDVSLSCVLTREDAPPKPDPCGLLTICAMWNASVSDVVLMGDYLHDINCGRNAGMRTILYAPKGAPYYSHLADFCVSSFADAARLIDQLIVDSTENNVAAKEIIP